MPSIPRILEILFYSLAIFVPWLFVTFYPFRNNLRLNPNLIALLAAVMAAARIAVDMTTGLGIIENTIVIQLILLAVYILFCIASIRGPLVEMGVNLLIVVALAFATTTVVKNLEPVLTPSLQQAAYNWAYTVILLAMNGIIAVVYALVYQPAKAMFAKLYKSLTTPKPKAEPAEEEKSAETTEEAVQAPASEEKSETVPAAEAEEEKAEPAPAPEVKEEKIEAVPAPEAKEEKVEAAPAPEAKEEKIEATPAAEVKEEKVEAAPASEVKEEKAEPAPIPEVKEEQPAPVPEEPNHDTISTNQLLSMQYTNLNSRILESRQVRGNVRRSIDAMTESLNSKNYDKLRAQMMALRQQCTTTSYSQDVVLSVTLDYFAQVCSNRGIHMNVNLQLPEDISNIVNANDLIVILGNLLDNALDACKLQRHADRHITVSGNLYGKTLRFVVENTYEHPVVQAEDGTYLSTKYDGPGAGLKMVQAIASSYNGDVKIDHTNGLFQVTVTLNV